MKPVQSKAIPSSSDPTTEKVVSSENLDLRSQDIANEKVFDLLRLFPEARNEAGRIDFERLKLALGESVDVGRERYGMNWPGKADCFKVIQAPSMGTLRPCPEESVNWDATQNIFIEGDNLEVLKLLQKSYHKKIKVIYIDPPYNTGTDRIYPDNFRDSIKNYMELTGQTDGQGRRLSTNPEASGRFHTNWLNMMYPRLYLARNLLRDDGVIFISIDDKEAANLRKICDEVFGEENFLVSLYLQVRYPEKTLAEKNDYQKLIETVHVYQRSGFKPIKESEDYSIGKFIWRVLEKTDGRKEVIRGRVVTIFKEGEYEIRQVGPSIDNLKETWATGSVLKANASGKFFGDFLAPRKNEDGLGCLYKVEGIGDDGIGFRYFTGPKRADATKGKFFSGVPTDRRNELAAGESKKFKPILNFYNLADAFGNCTHEGNVAFNNGKKPIEFLQTLVSLAANGGDGCTVLDFFAGSCSTAHAVLDLNKKDGGNRKFIMVQLPEPLDPNDLRQKAAHDFCVTNGLKPNIAEIGKERIRRVIKKLNDEEAQATAKQTRNPALFSSAEGGAAILADAAGETLIPPAPDRGFKVFKLADSNFTTWDAQIAHEAPALEKQLELHVNHIRDGRTLDDILYELVLKSETKSESPLVARVEKIILAGKTVFSVAGSELMVCLEPNLTLDIIRAIADRKPGRVIFLDKGFAGNDQLMANAAQTFKTKGVTAFHTV